MLQLTVAVTTMAGPSSASPHFSTPEPSSSAHILQLEVTVHHHGPKGVQVAQSLADLTAPAQRVRPCVGLWGLLEHLVEHPHLQQRRGLSGGC